MDAFGKFRKGGGRQFLVRIRKSDAVAVSLYDFAMQMMRGSSKCPTVCVEWGKSASRPENAAASSASLQAEPEILCAMQGFLKIAH